ncbi:MAG: hypothetical protein VB934_18610, partial [Polyangiaceae bacterium]
SVRDARMGVRTLHSRSRTVRTVLPEREDAGAWAQWQLLGILGLGGLPEAFRANGTVLARTSYRVTHPRHFDPTRSLQ